MSSERQQPSQTTDSAGEPIARLTEYLRARGRRMTAQRRLIVEMIFSHHDHFDAEELMEHLQDSMKKREVSRPTVYRTLNELVEAGLLRKMILRGRSIYEHDFGYPEHDHLYCRQCHRLIEFHDERLTQLRDEVSRTHAFEADGHRMLITGVCADCAKQPERRRHV